MSTGIRVFTLDYCNLVLISQDAQSLFVRPDQIPTLMGDILRAASELAQNSSPGALAAASSYGLDDTTPSPLGNSVTGDEQHSVHADRMRPYLCVVDESGGVA